MKVPNINTKILDHDRQSVLKSLKNPVNQNFPEFVILNKKAAFEKFYGKLLNNLKDFEKQGFFFCLNIIYLKCYILYGFYIVVRI